VENKLSGKTLQVYLYLQRKKEPSGIREVQRDLGLSSPSVADYQIEKLVGMGLAAKDSHGRACIIKKVRVKELESYVSFGRFSVPRLAFYASVFSAVAVIRRL
jgi:predicted DNA-binding transcriptional regulator